MQNLEQLKSSDPAHSVWVSASAGTGKTKVLTDRVIRLLLTGVQPSKILCLTFTNAAAAEMAERINRELKSFAQSSYKDLEQRLKGLIGRSPIDTELSLARNLFFIILDSTEEVQIHTIHAFCQSLLHKFPFEAGITPGFEVVDDIKADEIIRKVSSAIFSIHEEGETKEALKFVAANVHEATIEELLKEIISSKLEFKSLIERTKNSAEYNALLREKMFLSPPVASHGSPELTSQESYEILNRIRDDYYLATGERVEFEQLKSTFLTKDGKPRKKLLTQKEAELHPQKLVLLEQIQNKVLEACDAINTLNLIEASTHLFAIASHIIGTYEAYKRERGLLDYDDLIHLSQKLLGTSEFREWVLYKLDGGLEAILVDEAQDTSRAQWQIIESLMQEFYAGLDEKNRTVFVVGDEKQSIYSFQGASLDAYTGMGKYLKNQMDAAVKPHHVIDLAWSYRSTDAILSVVNQTFTKGANDKLFPEFKALEIFRSSHPGRVELWPIIKQNAKPEVFWPILTEEDNKSSEERLAASIASFIKQEIASGKILPSTGRPLAPQNFMILLKRRGRLAGQIIRALQTAGLEVGGIDRLALSDSISVLDLLSLARFVLQPLDDLNLACLLKSPFIGMSEKGLQTFALKQKGSLRQKLIEGSDAHSVQTVQKLQGFIDLYLSKSMQDFFYIILDGLEYRRQLLVINGVEENDSINELLYLVDNFTRNVSSSLQEFIIWFDKNEVEIKRDPESSDKIRVMTVHGSKGLQSGVVILADTVSMSANKDKILWTDDGLALWAAGAAKNSYFEQQKEAREDKQYKEYLRLLYVAMTRAEDRLIITGNTNDNSASRQCWYDMVRAGMQEMDAVEEAYSFLNEPVLVHESPGSCDRSHDIATSKSSLPLPLLPPISQNFIINRTDRDNPVSPLTSMLGIEYGSIFHKVIEDIIKTGEASLSEEHPMLSLLNEKQRNFMMQKAQELFAIEEFKEILKLDIKTEVSIGLQGRDTKIGRIDLMAMDNEKVIIIDYKTDKKPPKDGERAPQKYIDQLSFYRDAISRIYPEHKVETKILWLENLMLMNM